MGKDIWQGRLLTEEEIIDTFEKKHKAVWFHDGDPQKPHIKLNEVLCTSAFFNCSRALQHPALCKLLASQLVRKLKPELEEMEIKKVDMVICSSESAITLSYEVASILGAVHSFVEKDLWPLPTDINAKLMLWRKFPIPENFRILQIEDLIVTGWNINEIRRAVNQGNPFKVNFLPIVGTIFYCPPDIRRDYRGVKIVSLVKKEVWQGFSRDCPLCKKGSERVAPEDFWLKLTGEW